jgi:hypothetical protein
MGQSRAAAPPGQSGGTSNVHTRPTALSVAPAGIPDEMKRMAQWVVWRYVWESDGKGERKWKKIPLRADTRKAASTTNPGTWSTFERALASYCNPRFKLDGIGFVFAPDGELGGIDSDDALGPDGQVLEWARPYVDRLATYGEVSPSGAGVKFIGRFRLDDDVAGARADGIHGPGTAVEVYDRGRYFAITGRRFGDADAIGDASAEAVRLHRMIRDRLAPKASSGAPAGPAKLDLDDEDLIARARAAKNGAKFRRLFDDGDVSEYAADDSRADFALARMLHYWTRGDAARMERLFGRSALGAREKWAREDYRRRTVEAAIRAGGKVYEPSANGRHRGGDPQPTEANADPQGPGERPGRMEIVFEKTELHTAIDRADEALGREDAIYVRGPFLVRVVPFVGRRKRNQPGRPQGAPILAMVEPPTLAELLCKHAVFLIPGTNRAGTEVLKPASPPDKVVSGLLARKGWAYGRHVAGIVEAPTIRPDGSVLDTPGWDEETGLLYIPNAEFLPVPEAPTKENAEVAARLLMDLVTDFPFADDNHKAAWLASLLTIAARGAIEGPTPIFLFDANTPGAGKSHLAKIAGIIATGREMEPTPYPSKNEEMEKILTCITIAGDPFIFFDNLPNGGSLGCAPLDMAVTAGRFKGRILGKSEMPALDWNAVVFATGNNIELAADALRRVNPCRLDSKEERPEEREDFRLKPDCPCGCRGDIIRHAGNRRPALLQAALTILRAHAVEGRPAPFKLTPIDFPAWSQVIRTAVAWATGFDPCEPRKAAIAGDKATAEREAVVIGWKLLCAVTGDSKLSAAKALDTIEFAPGAHSGLREVFLSWSRDGRLPSTRIVGNRLGAMRGRVTPAGTLDFKIIDGNRHWYVEDNRSGSVTQSGSHITPAGEICTDNSNTNSKDSRENQSHSESLSHSLNAPRKARL